MSWEYEIEVPHVVVVGGEHIEIGTFSAIVECQPDESVGDTDWYISGVALDGLIINPMIVGNPRAEKVSRHWLHETHPLRKHITQHAYRHCADDLDRLWTRWQNDLPRKAKRGSGWALS